MSLRPYKFIVKAVVQNMDTNGDVVAEIATDEAVVFGCDALAKWATEFPDRLAEVADQPPR